MPNYPALIFCLTIGAWGSGAFHAAGMVNANASGGTRYPTMATSVFFLFGQTGLAVGPIVAGFYLERIGLAGMAYQAFTERWDLLAETAARTIAVTRAGS